MWVFKSNTRLRGTRGFTLIEMLVVMAIIAVLAGLSFVMLTRAVDGAYRNQAKGEIAALSLALNDYELDNGRVPEVAFIPKSGSPIVVGYEGNATEEEYYQASRALYFILSGRRKYDDDADSLTTTKDYLAGSSREWIGDASASEQGTALSGAALAKDPRDYNLFDPDAAEVLGFDGGTYLESPWGEPYGFYYGPPDEERSVFNKSSYDVWTTAGETVQPEDDEGITFVWVSNWQDN